MLSDWQELPQRETINYSKNVNLLSRFFSPEKKQQHARYAQSKKVDEKYIERNNHILSLSHKQWIIQAFLIINVKKCFLNESDYFLTLRDMKHWFFFLRKNNWKPVFFTFCLTIHLASKWNRFYLEKTRKISKNYRWNALRVRV